MTVKPRLSRFGKKGTAELRIVIGKKFWGQAVGAKVAQLLIEAAFDQLHAKVIVGVVHPKHTASIRLLRSFHFRRRGAVFQSNDSWQIGHLIYRLTERAYNE